MNKKIRKYKGMGKLSECNGVEGYPQFATFKQAENGNTKPEIDPDASAIEEILKVLDQDKDAMQRTLDEQKGKKDAEFCSLFPLFSEPIKEEINLLKGFTDANQHGWTHVRGVMDSGASKSVAPPKMCPEYKLLESDGSRNGDNFVSASKDIIPNLGEKHLMVMKDDGSVGRVRYQVADISRPLNSVSEICDSGNQVIFGRGGGCIVNTNTGSRTYFGREENVYVLDLWVMTPSMAASYSNETMDPGFTGQGS